MRNLVASVWVALLGTCALSVSAGEGDPWSIQDSIGLSYFLLPNDMNAVMPAVEAAKPVLSPDGTLFYVVTEKGDVGENINLTELRIYANADILAALKQATPTAPSPLATHIARSRISGSMDPGIKELLWAKNSRSLMFLEYGIDGAAQVMRMDVQTSATKTLSNAPLGVSHYAVQGDLLTFTAQMTLRRADVSDVIKFPFSYVRDKEWFAALQFMIGTHSVFMRRADGTIVQASRETQGVASDAYPSPDGRWVIVKKRGAPLEEIPDWAREMALASGQRPVMLEYFYLRDLHEPLESERFLGLSGVIFEYGGVTSALWSPDSKQAILINAIMPSAKGVAQKISAPSLIEFEVSTGESQVIGTMPAPKSPNEYPDTVIGRWLSPGNSFVLEPYGRKADRVVVHSLRKGRWSSRTASYEEAKLAAAVVPIFPPGLQVAIRQGLNVPPRLVASRASRELTLWDPNPQLAERRPLPIELIHWTDENGITWDGNLVLPPGPKPANAYPLVLVLAHQTYPSYFMPDGYVYAPGNAAQEMAVQGMAHLTLNTRNPAMKGKTASTKEGPTIVAGADAAVAELARRSLIDPTRVGVMGYSRMGWATLYLSTHQRGFVPAAAIVQDSADASYLQYMQGAAMGEVRPSEIARMYTDKPGTFWDDKQAWMDAPGFMMDRMQSPLLIEHHYGPYIAGLLTMVEPYAAMRHLGRPVEVVAFNGGSHVHTQPSHRLASMQLAVDWMRFWLKDEENKNPMNLERNRHWRSMRDAWIDKPYPARPVPAPARDAVYHP